MGTAHHTVGTTFKHILRLCFQPWQTVSSIWLPPADVAAAGKALGKPVSDVTVLLRSVLTRMIKDATEVEVRADKFTEFMAFWDMSQKKGYTQQAQKKRA